MKFINNIIDKIIKSKIDAIIDNYIEELQPKFDKLKFSKLESSDKINIYNVMETFDVTKIEVTFSIIDDESKLSEYDNIEFKTINEFYFYLQGYIENDHDFTFNGLAVYVYFKTSRNRQHVYESFASKHKNEVYNGNEAKKVFVKLKEWLEKRPELYLV